MDYRTVASLLRLFIRFMFLGVAVSFNLDTNYTVIKQGPPGSLFGFAVAEHQVTNAVTNKVEQWILASAPKANSTLIPTSIQTGTVFKCSATNSTSICKDELPFDRRISSSSENKNNQWFGVSLKSGGKDKSVLACAHRYLSYGPGDNFHLLSGKCRSIEGNLESSEYSFSPCEDPINRVQVPAYTNYGQCLTGIGADIISDQSPMRFLFGAVGVENFEGRAFEHLAADDSNFLQSSKIKNMELSYFGYSMAHGNYLLKTRKDIAMGGPRSDSTGKVIILKRSGTNVSRIITLPAAEDKVQFTSAFGFAVCTHKPGAKSSNSYDQLLVGAPFHQNEAAESGQVYVYSRASESSMKLFTKLSVAVPRANFGASIASPGDLNLDGYNDIVVGAPYENDFRGAVYVYMGTAKGFSAKYTQKIAASALDSNLRAFGRSLAGGMDLDSNGYNDIVVGAFVSNQVAMIRSRPVIKIVSKIITRPTKINPEDYKTKDQTFQIIVEFYYEERSKRLKSDIEAKLKLVMDPGRTPRIRFSKEDTNIAEEVILVRNVVSRRRLPAYLSRDKDGKFQSFPDVRVSLSFELTEKNVPPVKDVVTSLDKRPILESHDLHDLHMENVHLFEKGFIQFKRDCDPCVPDLMVIASKNLTIRLGKVNVKLNAAIENKGKDTAFQTDVIVTLPKGISVSSIMLPNGDLKLCEDAVALPSGKQTTKCKNILNEIKSKAKEKIEIVLDTKRLSGDLDDKIMSINVSSANAEDGTYLDNVMDIQLKVVAKADLNLQGKAITRREFYGGSIVGESAIKEDKEAGHEVKHQYFVINNGPDKIPSAVITIHWPYETVSGKHLFYLMDVQSSEAKCTFARGQRNELRLKSSTSSSIDFNATVPGALTLDRRRRDVSEVNETTPSSKSTDPPPAGQSTEISDSSKGVHMEGKVLDCRKKTAKCTSFTCKVDDFRSRKGVQILISARIWNSTLLMDYKTQTLSVVSHASVAVGSNASYISDPNMLNNKASVFTVLYSEAPKPVKERVAVWKIVLAVLAGIILLALLVFGLYKLGFFKRGDKSKSRKSKKEEAYEDDDLLDKKAAMDDQE